MGLSLVGGIGERGSFKTWFRLINAMDGVTGYKRSYSLWPQQTLTVAISFKSVTQFNVQVH